MFISLEGPEGAGKSTQLPQLGAWLEQQGHEVFTTRNPGGTPIGAQIRQVVLDASNRAMVPTTELMLYAADRAQHVAEVVRPALAAGTIVLCDRFTDSTMAYQGYGRGLDKDLIRQLNAMATGGLRPDLTLLLDLPVEEGLARAAKARAADRLENEQIAFHHRLRAGYLALAAEDPDRFVVIDARQAPDDVQGQLREAVSRLLGKRS
ncbi:MAG: tmk [Cyanobacteria bacterium RYN_339]|nr:tmk [Cyanobacteria bacterium RYN_339]